MASASSLAVMDTAPLDLACAQSTPTRAYHLLHPRGPKDVRYLVKELHIWDYAPSAAIMAIAPTRRAPHRARRI